MTFIKNLKEGRFGMEGTFFSPLFNQDIGLSIDKDVSVEYAEICINYFNSLGEDLVQAFCEAAIRYCNDFLVDIGEETKDFATYKEVLKLITPSSLMIPEAEQGLKPVVHMGFECEWEVEHGMEIVIRDNKLLYLGAFNGEYPWYDYESKKKDFWNYA
ncbi:MAG: hypothetical protein MI810_01980 [Flavobacteriales bacterium]|jgi:hypothetical protein|nr:hypothetical protein [Flavobacteriales bacterium]